MTTIVNCHVRDPKNVGDLLSAPAQYFAFPGYTVEQADIRTIEPETLQGKHLIIGGGGLLFPRFAKDIAQLSPSQPTAKLIAWGIGQQIYDEANPFQIQGFNYSDYLERFDQIGIRDYGSQYPWVPCASCMHPAFDQKRSIQHEFVVFSHKKFQLKMNGFPRMTNETQRFEEVLNFLASGETILTSSYHGAYWGMLLGRKVLAFPFSSKFYTLKHQPGFYPVEKWTQAKYRIQLFQKTIYELHYKNKFFCSVEGWQNSLHRCQAQPESLEECRERNRGYYSQVMDLLNNSS